MVSTYLRQFINIQQSIIRLFKVSIISEGVIFHHLFVVLCSLLERLIITGNCSYEEPGYGHLVRCSEPLAGSAAVFDLMRALGREPAQQTSCSS